MDTMLSLKFFSKRKAGAQCSSLYGGLQFSISPTFGYGRLEKVKTYI